MFKPHALPTAPKNPWSLTEPQIQDLNKQVATYLSDLETNLCTYLQQQVEKELPTFSAENHYHNPQNGVVILAESLFHLLFIKPSRQHFEPQYISMAQKAFQAMLNKDSYEFNTIEKLRESGHTNGYEMYEIYGSMFHARDFHSTHEKSVAILLAHEETLKQAVYREIGSISGKPVEEIEALHKNNESFKSVFFSCNNYYVSMMYYNLIENGIQKLKVLDDAIKFHGDMERIIQEFFK